MCGVQLFIDANARLKAAQERKMRVPVRFPLPAKIANHDKPTALPASAGHLAPQTRANKPLAIRTHPAVWYVALMLR